MMLVRNQSSRRRLGEPTFGWMSTTAPSSWALLPERQEARIVEVDPVDELEICTPLNPRSPTTCSSSATARAVCWSGTVPTAAKRSGWRRREFREPLVLHPGELTQVPVGPVVVLGHEGREDLDVDPHRVHVAHTLVGVGHLRAQGRTQRAVVRLAGRARVQVVGLVRDDLLT
jgi:hypothetical protein